VKQWNSYNNKESYMDISVKQGLIALSGALLHKIIVMPRYGMGIGTIVSCLASRYYWKEVFFTVYI